MADLRPHSVSNAKHIQHQGRFFFAWWVNLLRLIPAGSAWHAYFHAALQTYCVEQAEQAVKKGKSTKPADGLNSASMGRFLQTQRINAE